MMVVLFIVFGNFGLQPGVIRFGSQAGEDIFQGAFGYFLLVGSDVAIFIGVYSADFQGIFM